MREMLRMEVARRHGRRHCLVRHRFDDLRFAQAHEDLQQSYPRAIDEAWIADQRVGDKFVRPAGHTEEKLDGCAVQSFKLV
jgi:hypothetical protein